MKYLIVVAHPDDEVLGVGGSIGRFIRDGNSVEVAVLVGRAEARKGLSSTLLDEFYQAMNLLGVSKYYLGEFPNIKMNIVPHIEIVKFIEDCLIKSGADVVITHHPSDLNNDHRMTSEAAEVAIRLFQRREDVKSISKFMYMEVPSSTEWNVDPNRNKFRPNSFIEIGQEGIGKKLQALEIYKGVMRKYPHPRSKEFIKFLAGYRGGQSGLYYAEAFEIVFSRERNHR